MKTVIASLVIVSIPHSFQIVRANEDAHATWESILGASCYFEPTDDGIRVVSNGNAAASYIQGFIEGRFFSPMNGDARILLEHCFSRHSSAIQIVSKQNAKNQEKARQIIEQKELLIDSEKLPIDGGRLSSFVRPAVNVLALPKTDHILASYSSVGPASTVLRVDAEGHVLWERELYSNDQPFEGDHWNVVHLVAFSKQVGVLTFTDQNLVISILDSGNGEIHDRVTIGFRQE